MALSQYEVAVAVAPKLKVNIENSCQKVNFQDIYRRIMYKQIRQYAIA